MIYQVEVFVLWIHRHILAIQVNVQVVKRGEKATLSWLFELTFSLKGDWISSQHSLGQWVWEACLEETGLHLSLEVFNLLFCVDNICIIVLTKLTSSFLRILEFLLVSFILLNLYLIASTGGFVHSFVRILDAQSSLWSFTSVSKRIGKSFWGD